MTVKTREADATRPTDSPPVVEPAAAEALLDAGDVKTNSLVIIAESGDLEKTWATTIMASTAAASGMEVSIFFTFWGFFPLVRPEKRITGKNWMQKMLSIMNRPGIDHLKLSRMNFMGMGPWMMKRLAREHGVASPGELLTAAQAMGVKLLPCQMSMDLLGFTREDLIDGLEEPVGAATVLQLIASGTPAIFI